MVKDVIQAIKDELALEVLPMALIAVKYGVPNELVRQCWDEMCEDEHGEDSCN